jgi:hypothetical protein
VAGSSDEWADYAKRHMKAELKRAGVGYAELARRLSDMGLAETEGSVDCEDQPRRYAWFCSP